MIIKNVLPEDIATVLEFYNSASKYQQEKKTVIVWPNFDADMVKEEILENRQFKLMVDKKVACIWAITFSDAQIWEEKNRDSALYIHRIAVHKDFRGNKYVPKIVAWAKAFCLEKNIQFIRLDTLGENTKLIAHYKNAGFNFLGLFHLKNTSNLPAHYKLAPVCLFEIDLNKT